MGLNAILTALVVPPIIEAMRQLNFLDRPEASMKRFAAVDALALSLLRASAHPAPF